MAAQPRPFPVLRWIALLWMLIWFPAYFHYWGWTNLFHLCDVAVLLSFFGVWFANSLLTSSQAISSLGPGVFWIADVGWKLLTGRYLVGGTDYMWDARYPLWVRLLSTFHIALPLVLLYTVRRLGYDRRGLAFQSGIAVVLLVLSRFLSADLNMNYAYRDPVWHRAWAPAPLHVALMLAVIVLLIYVPTHLLLRATFYRVAHPVPLDVPHEA